MTYYAEIDTNGVCFSELETFGEISKQTMIVTDGFGYLGKTWNGSAWADAQPVTKRILTKLEAMNRFTDAELAAIYTAAKSSVTVEIWLEKFKAAQEINLDDASFISGLSGLVTAGLLAANRPAEILA